MYLHIRHFTSKNIHFIMIKTWLKSKNHGQFLFVLGVFHTPEALCLLQMPVLTTFMQSLRLQMQERLAERCWRWSTKARLGPNVLEAEQRLCCASQLGLWEQSLWRVKILSRPAPHIIAALLLHMQLSPWPYQHCWFEMYVCPLGTVAGVTCYSQFFSKEKKILFQHSFKEMK